MNYTMMVLMFVLGYLTCKTFYYLRSARLGITLIQTSNLFSLFILARALENYEISRTLCLADLKRKNMSERNLDIYKENLQREVDSFKKKSIDSLLAAHPHFFKSVTNYNDWDSGMKFLEDHRDLIIKSYSKPGGR